MGPSDLYNKAAELGLQFSEGYDNQQGSGTLVTFNSRKAGSTQNFSSYALARVRQSKVSDGERVMRGLLGVTVNRFHVPQVALDNATPTNGGAVPAPAPKPNDQFVDPLGNTWVVNDEGADSITNNGYVIEFVCMATLLVS